MQIKCFDFKCQVCSRALRGSDFYLKYYQSGITYLFTVKYSFGKFKK